MNLGRRPRLPLSPYAFGVQNGESALSSLECTQIVGRVRIFRRQSFDIAGFDVDFFYAGPFCARTEEPAPLSDDACSVKRITRDQKLHALARLQIRTYDDVFACSIFVQHKNFNRIAPGNGDKADRCGYDAGAPAPLG
jgi:hypothetical protein